MLPLLLMVVVSVCGTDVVVGVSRNTERMAEMERLFWRVSDPSDPMYAQYLTLDDVQALLRSDEHDIAAVSSWLQAEDCVSHLQDDQHTIRATCPSVLPGPPPGLPVDYVHVARATGEARPAQRRPSEVALTTTPDEQRDFYKLPSALHATNASNLQMVWGCGTFGFNPRELGEFYGKYCKDCSTDDVKFDTSIHGHEGGDNFVEGTLDTTYISTFGKGVMTLVSNTNSSSATEEGEGQGIATVLAMEAIVNRPPAALPRVLSLSLGSLGYETCDYFCTQYAADGHGTYGDCHTYLQEQRQVCLYASRGEQESINTAFKALALRGVTVVTASGDGGPHWSFGPFPSEGIGAILNKYGGVRTSPVFPANSPYVVAVGGISWKGGNANDPVAWTQHEGCTGGGFSWEWPAPPHQVQTVEAYLNASAGHADFPAAVAFNAAGRAFPDVAAFMDGIPLCFDGVCHESIVGGTSASTPTFAGMVSLLNDLRMNKGLPTLGFVAPRIWKVAAQFPGEAFRSIPGGDASCGASTGSYFPGADAWDPQTGWGSPLWPGLVEHFTQD